MDRQQVINSFGVKMRAANEWNSQELSWVQSSDIISINDSETGVTNPQKMLLSDTVTDAPNDNGKIQDDLIPLKKSVKNLQSEHRQLCEVLPTTGFRKPSNRKVASLAAKPPVGTAIQLLAHYLHSWS